MDGDMNYYQTSYHQGGGPSAAMKHPPAAPTDAYPRARTIPGGPIPSGAPLSHHQSYSSDTMSYGSRAPATGPQPLRKTMDSVGTSVPSGLPPSMLRDYSYERNNPYDDKKMHTASRLMPTESAVSQQQHSSITGYPNRAAYLHEEAASHHPKYEMHGSGSTVGRVHGGYPNEDISVSKMSSYSAGGAPGMLHSSRDLASINAYDRDYAREHEPQTRSTVPAVSSLEKYFSSEEIKQFSDYNRHLAMSTPVQQKKFYESLTTAEYNRFRDFVDFDRNNKPSANFKAALPPPIPSAAPLPVPTPYDNHSTAYPSSYSFASSFYEEDKMSSGSGGHRPPIHHLKSKYSNSSGSPPPQPPPMPPFMKGMSSYQAFPESSYERSLSTRDLSTGMSRYADMSMRMGRADLRETLPPERSLGHERSARPGYHLSRSRSRSITPENRSRSSRYHRHGSPSRREEYPKHSKGYLLRESRTDSHSHSRSRRSHSRSPGARDRKRSRKSLSKEGKESVDGREHKQSSAVQNSTRKLAPKEEHYYLLDSLTKVRKIHKVKLEELEEIKKKDDGKCDSYIYKKVASSVKDIEERIATVERQLEANRIVLGDSFPEVEKAYEEKEKEKKTSLKALRGMETKSKPVSDTKVTNDEPTEKKKNELSKDASSSSIVSSASTIEATAETVAKLPKIPKLSAKKSADVDDSDDETKTAKKPTDDDASNESATAKKSSNKEEIKNGSVKSSNVEPSSSNKSESKEPSKPTSARYSGPITEDEIEQILPFYQYCSLCKNFFESTDEFITHLHREAHLNGLRTSDFLIIKRAEEKLDTQMLSAEQASVAAVNGSDKAPVVATNALETLGSEFLYPCKAFYCDLCAKFLYTTQQTELHLSSEKHVTLYKKYLQKNKEYAPKMINQRKSAFKYSYLLRTLIRMKDKGEDIVTRVSQEMVRRAKKEREKNEREKEKEKSSESVDKESSVAESSNAETDTKKLSVKKENDDNEDTVQTASKNVAEKTENSVDLTKVKKEEVEVSVKPEENENGSSSGQNEEENEDNDENGENEEDEEESPETVGEGDNDENGNADDLENVNLEEEDYEEIMDLNETNEGIFEMNIEDMNIFGDEVDKFLSEQQAANGNIAQQVNDIIMQEEEEDTEEEEENVAGQNEEEDGSFDVIDEA